MCNFGAGVPNGGDATDPQNNKLLWSNSLQSSCGGYAGELSHRQYLCAFAKYSNYENREF